MDVAFYVPEPDGGPDGEPQAMILQMMKSRPVNPNPAVEELRAGFEAMTVFLPPAADVTSEPVKAGTVPAEWVSAPGASPERIVLYLHGGGYAIGSVNTHRDLVSRISRAAAARSLSINYRLAPEHPHPAVVDDAKTAYRWLLAEGVEPKRIALAGDSAGGGLTVATLVALRDAGVPLRGAGVCLSPWIDLEGTGESMATKASEDPIVQRHALLMLAGWYLGEASPKTPLAAPLYADVSGLPPLLIHVGTAETLLDDATRLAANARCGGVDVTLESWGEMIHGWHLFAALLPEGDQAIERIGEFVRMVGL